MSGCVPAAHLFKDWFTIGQLAGVAGRNIHGFSIQPISNTHSDWIDVIKSIQVGYGDLVDSIDHPRITSGTRLEPPARRLGPGVGAKLASGFWKGLSKCLFLVG